MNLTMNTFERIIYIFDNAILMDFQKFGTLLQNSASRQDIVECCHDILVLRLKMKRHFKELADLLESQFPFSKEVTSDEYKQLHAIYEMAYTLLYVPTGYEQTSITDELKRITKVFEDVDWNFDTDRVLPDFNNPALS